MSPNLISRTSVRAPHRLLYWVCLLVPCANSDAESSFLLGGLSTVVASYLANARGSNEPDLSKTRVKDLNQFLRDCDAFIKDHGHLRKDPADINDPLNQQLVTKRKRLEEILGNINRPDAISGK